MHLAQINIARWKIPADDPRAAGFMDNLDRVNALAERAPGFVWRLMGDGNDATDIRAFEDEAFIVNMSVWESPEMLEEFVWNTVHRRIYERRHEWFEFAGDQRFVMWWIAPGHIPTLDEAKERLAHLNAHGDSDHAFGWAHLPHIKLWQKRSCA